MNQHQLLSQKITCVFETGDSELSTASVEDLGDGRGYTCGWAGFTTADEEVVACVEEYGRTNPGNDLEPMLDELRRLHSQGSDDTSGLDDAGFKKLWEEAAKDDDFNAAYASVVDRIFGQPAQGHVEELGLQSPIAYAILFDSVIQHGNDKDPDGVPAMIGRTYEQATDPSADEAAWLGAFLAVRRETLQNPANRETAKEWRKSVSRVEALENILKENADLETPISVKSSEHDEEVD